MPTLSHGAAQAQGRNFATRPVDDDADNKSAGVYAHLNRQASATMYNELQNEVAGLVAWSDRVLLKNSASPRAKGDLIYLAGYSASDNAFTFGLADGDAGLPAQFVIIEDIAANAAGHGARAGLLGGLNTSALSANAALYLGGTPGAYTATQPSGVNDLIQVIGSVKTVHATAGEIDFCIAPPRKIGTPSLQDSSIAAAKLAADSVTTTKILDANVTAAKLASNSVTTAKISDANVTLAKLADPVQDLLPAPALSVGAENSPGADDRQVTVQVQDAGGNNLAGTFLLRLWISTSDKGAPGGGQTLAVATGTNIQTVAANQDAWVETDSTGKAVVTLNISGAATLYCMTVLNGKVISTTVTFT